MKTQTKLLLIRIAGAITILFTLFHSAFYWIFNWAESMKVLNQSDRGIMLTFNLICILLLLYSVIMTLGFTQQLITTITGKSLLLFFTMFYLLRIVTEFVWFGFQMPGSPIIIGLCLIPAICFLLPVLLKSKTNKASL